MTTLALVSLSNTSRRDRHAPRL